MNLRVITCLAIPLVFCVTGCQRNFLPSTFVDPPAINPQVQILEIEKSIAEAHRRLASPAANWNFGNLSSGDAYRDADTFNVLNSQIKIERKKAACLEGIEQVNDAIRLINGAKVYDQDLAALQMAELRFLRGHLSFELQRIADVMPSKAVSTGSLSSRPPWTQIEADFKVAAISLPFAGGPQPGRPNRFAAFAYLAKTYLYQKKWAEAIRAADEVIDNGGYSLMPGFAEHNNNREIIFAIKYFDEEVDAHPYRYFYVIRYADVLLWRAEAAIELADYETGRKLINQVRHRARDGKKNQKAGHVTAYKIAEYTTLFDCYECAIDALKEERRLEFALEGHRYFDLLRWGGH